MSRQFLCGMQWQHQALQYFTRALLWVSCRQRKARGCLNSSTTLAQAQPKTSPQHLSAPSQYQMHPPSHPFHPWGQWDPGEHPGMGMHGQTTYCRFVSPGTSLLHAGLLSSAGTCAGHCRRRIWTLGWQQPLQLQIPARTLAPPRGGHSLTMPHKPCSAATSTPAPLQLLPVSPLRSQGVLAACTAQTP